MTNQPVILRSKATKNPVRGSTRSDKQRDVNKANRPTAGILRFAQDDTPFPVILGQNCDRRRGANCDCRRGREKGTVLRRRGGAIGACIGDA